MSFLPQNPFFLWIDWCQLAPAHIRCRPPTSARNPLDYAWQFHTNQLVACNDARSAMFLLSHLQKHPSFLTVVTTTPTPLLHSILSKNSFLIASCPSNSSIFVDTVPSYQPVVYFVSGWLPPPASPTHIATYIHPMWDTNVPTRRQPLCISAWFANLALHPNDNLVLSTMDNGAFGASYGYTGNRLVPVLNPTHKKFYEMDVQPCLDKDIEKGFRTKPFPISSLPPLPNCHRYPVKGVDKTFDVKVRLVNAQGAPYNGLDVNSNISIINSTLFTFQVAMALLLISGPGTLMFKFDAEAAFKVLNLHVQDYHLNGESIPDAWAFSVKPNFGVKSSGKLWDALGGLAEFIFRAVASLLLRLHFLVRYSDDFLQLIPVCDNHSLWALSVFAAIFLKAQELGLSIGKFTYPSTEIVWLGLILNSVTMTASLTNERRLYLLHHLVSWQSRQYASRKEIESLHGHLQFAASIIKHGRFFLGDITALIYAQPDRNMIEISTKARIELAWWHRLLVSYDWSGISYFVRDDWIRDFDLKLEICTDACKAGRGIYFDGRWAALAWTSDQLTRAHRFKALSMVFLELHAIVDACATFGKFWRNKKITLQTDSQACVDSWKNQRSHNAELRFLFREICLLSSMFDFDLNIIHIPGKLNVKADLLSRLQVLRFLKLCPDAECSPTRICEWWQKT